MDFPHAADGYPHALEWHEQLRTEGQRCDSLDFSAAASVPLEYQCAVAWHNIEVDGQLGPSQQTPFAEIIDAAWADPDDRPSPLPQVVYWRRLQRRGLEARYSADVSGAGPPGEVEADANGAEMLCSFFKPPRVSNADLPSPGGADEPGTLLDEHRCEELLDNMLDENKHGPIVWLARSEDVAAYFQPGGHDIRDAIAAVGLERFQEEGVYRLIVRREALGDELRVPTVADSRLGYLFQATRTGPSGRTRHTERGRDHGVAEWVVRRDVLQRIRAPEGSPRRWKLINKCGTLHPCGSRPKPPRNDGGRRSSLRFSEGTLCDDG